MREREREKSRVLVAAQRTYHVESWAHKVLLDESERVLARDALQHVLRALLGVDTHAALGATERNVGQRTLEGHQRSERHHLLCVSDRANRANGTCQAGNSNSNVIALP